MSENNENLLTVKEIASYMKINERTIYKLAKEKQIPALKIGGTWRFNRSVIDKWVNETMTKNCK